MKNYIQDFKVEVTKRGSLPATANHLCTLVFCQPTAWEKRFQDWIAQKSTRHKAECRKATVICQVVALHVALLDNWHKLRYETNWFWTACGTNQLWWLTAFFFLWLLSFISYFICMSAWLKSQCLMQYKVLRCWGASPEWLTTHPTVILAEIETLCQHVIILNNL